MKKIIALLLALSCIFALAACKPDNSNTADAIEPFKTAIAATAVSTANVKVTATNDFIPEYPLTAEYDVAYAADGSATVTYVYTQYNEISGNTDNIFSTHRGTATISPDGTVTGDVSATVASAAGVSFNLDADKMTASASMGILTANITAGNTAAVLGSAVGADVVLTISTGNGVVTGATISYTLDGVDYEIVCTYN